MFERTTTLYFNDTSLVSQIYIVVLYSFANCLILSQIEDRISEYYVPLLRLHIIIRFQNICVAHFIVLAATSSTCNIDVIDSCVRRSHTEETHLGHV